MRLALFFYVVLLAWEVENLTCKCESCTADFCVVDPKGACAALAYRNTSNLTQTIIQRKCFNSSELKVIDFCNASNSKVVVQCCSSHFCNADLSPKPPPAGGPPPGTVAAPGPPRPTLILVPTNPPSRPLTPIECYRYNSNKPPKKYPFCNTVSGSCYKLQRLASNGTVILEKQGCMNNCVNERRNRLVRECCNTSHCNGQQPPSPSSTSLSPSSTTVQKTTTLSIASSTVTHSSTSTAYTYSTPSTPLPNSTSSNPLPSPTTKNIEIRYITGDLDSNSLSYALILLCIIYIFVTLLVLSLVLIICYKQRQVNQLKSSIKVQKQSKALQQNTSSVCYYDTSSSGSTSV